MDNDTNHEWHVRINRASVAMGFSKMRWMYEAKNIAEESRRLPILFKQERTGALPKIHRQCSHSPGEAVIDNHLTCCLGTQCRKCEFLAALDAPGIAPEELDQIKAWTCIAHILNEDAGTGRIDTSEGMILTTDDRMFWDKVYENLSYDANAPDDE
jgi:hypothetical protein